MRYLNRIIFINSAHIPYAEIKLDGNVHFIGTQGVGKSTLLRAILFFYNVDKSKLGIRTQDKQKSYDEFYFPYPNSYVIYEICRENGTFFVMTFSSNGRVAFRIVDCPYEKRFFVDKDNHVMYEWGRISERIGTKVYRSNIIRGYEEFRDILYGNIQNVTKELRRFNLMESSKYQNVPRTIQNIFLNQSLESRVIKDTIIDSMDFAGDGIDLNFYREHVKDFRQQYEDIWKWYKKEKNGKVKVKVDAENVIDRYSLYELSRKNLLELCAKLNYALNRDTEQLPQIEDAISIKTQELDRLKRLLGEENDKYNKERDELKAKEAVLSDFLRKTKEKKQHYAEIGIDAILEKIAKEKEWEIRKESLAKEESVLTDKSQNVKLRYDTLIQTLKNSLQAYILQSEQRVNEIDRRLTETVAEMQTALNEKGRELHAAYQQKMEDIQESMNEAHQEKAELKLQEQKLSQYNPFQKEMDDLSAQMRELEESKLHLALELNQKRQDIERITNEALTKRKEIENAAEKELLKLAYKQDGLRKEANSLEELLNKQKGSFIEWLDENVADWKETIGKVVDNNVLYNASLSPQKVEKTDTLYGIRLELQHIEKNVQTPDEIQARILTLKQKIDLLDKAATEARRKLENDIKEVERIPNTKVKNLRSECTLLDVELRQIPLRIDGVKKKLAEYEIQLRDWRKKELDAVREQLGRAEEQIVRCKTQKQQTALQKQKEEESLRKSFDSRRKEAEIAAKQEKDKINAGVKQQEEETEARQRQLEALMNAELKDLGVDVDKLSEIRKEMQRIDEELAYIEVHRPDYYDWLRDRKEYFDVALSKKEERKQLLQKLDDLQFKFNRRRAKKETELHLLTEDIRTMQAEKTTLEEAIEKVKTFMANPTCPTGMAEAGVKETQERLSAILDSLRDNISAQQQRMEEFKKAIIAFKSNFSPQNTFHFRTEFNTETDYTDFASELNEFISNKKIEEYRTRTSNQYAGIIKRIAREVGDLNRHNAEIKATINEINRDFRENNFAGVIKEIELRAVESSDRLMQQLLNIKKFEEEHGFNIGQLNLFSTVDDLNKTNETAVKLLMSLIDRMDIEQKRERITLSDTFKLEFKVKENDNDTNWVEKLSNVGSDGTDILVKSMVNIMLINVFKRKISRRFGDFKLHCMMDEIGKLHPDNVEGILKFANVRNIYLINSSPTTYNAQVYKYTYSLSKDEKSNTMVKTLLTIR